MGKKNDEIKISGNPCITVLHNKTFFYLKNFFIGIQLIYCFSL